MDDTQTIYLKTLVAKSLKAREDEESLDKKIEEMSTQLSQVRKSRQSYQQILKIENLDPDNIPSHLVEYETRSLDSQSSERSDEWLDLDTSEQDVLPLPDSSVASENNGHAKASNWPTPLNDTHAVFLVFKNLNNPWLNSEEIYQHNLKFGYGLTKEDVTRTIGRQMGRPKKLFLKEGNKYKLSPLGVAFDKFRKAPEKQEGAEQTALL